jgi:UDP-N-acetyl-D-galactosamine dehydrogenase
VFVHDPLASAEEALHEYGVKLYEWDQLPAADALILAVPHQRLLAIPQAQLQTKIVRNGCVIDVKSALDAESLRAAGLRVWRL